MRRSERAGYATKTCVFTRTCEGGYQHSVMNNTLAFIFAVLLLILGGILFMYRILYMFCQNKPWNNPPTTLSWAWTACLTGLLVLLVVIFTPGCENKCAREHGLIPASLIFGGILLLMPVFVWCVYAKTRREKPHVVGEEVPPDQARSGYDILLLMIGLGIILADMSLGSCPESC